MMKRRFITTIAALLFIMMAAPMFADTGIYKDIELSDGRLYDLYVFDTEEDFLNDRESCVIDATGWTKHYGSSFFSRKESFIKFPSSKDTELMKRYLKAGNYAYAMIAWPDHVLYYAQVFKIVNGELYGAKYSSF